MARRKSGRAATRFWSEWRLELTAIVIIGVGVFLLVENLDMSGMVRDWILDLLHSLVEIFFAVIDAASGLLRPSNLLGMALMIAGVGLLIWRTRVRVARMAHLQATSCPSCGSTLEKRHRRLWGRIVSLIVPVRRYRCRSCEWNGWRVYIETDKLRRREDEGKTFSQRGD
jgi:hypothetical protein